MGEVKACNLAGVEGKGNAEGSLDGRETEEAEGIFCARNDDDVTGFISPCNGEDLRRSATTMGIRIKDSMDRPKRK